MNWFKNIVRGMLKGGPDKVPFYTAEIYRNYKYNIGEYTYGNPNIIFENEETNLTIGKFCSIADGVTIFLGGNHRTDWVSTYPFNVLNQEWPSAAHVLGHPSTKGDVVIGNDVWIGKNAMILSGVKIGNGAVIGAGSVVARDIGHYEIWAGNPAKLAKKRFSENEIEKLLGINWWNWPKYKIEAAMDLICSNNIAEFLKYAEANSKQ